MKFKIMIAKLLANICQRQIQYNQNQWQLIDAALSYEMRNMPVYMVQERVATRQNALEMQRLHTQKCVDWSKRLNRIQQWAKG